MSCGVSWPTTPRASSRRAGWARGMRAALVTVACLAPGAAAALESGEPLVLLTQDGDRMAGWFDTATASGLVLTGEGGRQTIALADVVEVWRGGVSVPVETLRKEHAEVLAAELAWRANPPPHPHPGVVVAASIGWSGAGHAALGEWGTAARWAAVDLALVGVASWALFGEQSWGAALPVLAVDGLIRGAAAGSSARVARRRRARLALPPPTGR